MRVKIQSYNVDEDDAEYDDDPEEDIEDPSALNGFVVRDKKFRGERIDVSKSIEKDCWPNQRCLSKIIIDRIRYALKNLGKTLEDFKVFDFQIYTANRNILELQTLSRMLEHEGVLPGYILTQSDTDKEKFANVRVQKYVHKPEKDVRLNEIKTKAKNPQCLQLLIFDEAHYGATQQTKEGFRQTPYSSILQHYNSQDYPNVIVLLVTATPWNLLTVCSKLSDSKVMYDPNTGELKSCDNALSAIHTNRKTDLHKISWNYCHEKEVQGGKELKLMAFHDGSESTYSMLEAFTSGHRGEVRCHQDSKFFKEKFNRGTTFTIEGSMYDYVRVSCINPQNGEKVYWTWTRPLKFNESKIIDLRPLDVDSPFQMFYFNAKYGNDLVAFMPYDKSPLYVQTRDGKLVVTAGRHSEPTNIPNCPNAPINRCFLILPKDTSSKFYLSLNHMVASIRFDEEDTESRRIRHDEVFTRITEKIKQVQKKYPKKFWKYPNVTISDILTADYCLVLLLRNSFLKIVDAVEAVRDNKLSTKEGSDKYYSAIADCDAKLVKFMNDLDPDLEHNASHKPINKLAFQAYILTLAHDIMPNDYDLYELNLPQSTYLSNRKIDGEIGVEVYILLRALRYEFLKSKNLAIEDDIKREFGYLVEDAENLRETIWSPFGASAIIIQKCLEKFEPENEADNGHMAILRASRYASEKGKSKKQGTTATLNGNRLKQSLCIARKIGGIDNLEIIQDYGATATMMSQLKNYTKSAEANAKQLNHPESLQIMQRIQSSDCETLVGRKNNRAPCSCSSYEPESEDSLVCKNCHHTHRKFKSYADLKGLPCLLILINNGRMGDTFPSSLIAMDDRSAFLKASDLKKNSYLAPFAQEKGRLCRYTKLASDLPFVYLGKGQYQSLESSLKKDCSYYDSFAQVKQFDRSITWNDTKKVLEPTEKSADFGNLNSCPRDLHFLLNAEPQCGKTGTYLQLIADLRQIVEKPVAESNDSETEEVDSESEDESVEVVKPFVKETRFQANVPHFQHLKTLAPMSKSCSLSKYSPYTGKYKHPVTKAPNVPASKRSTKFVQSKRSHYSHDLITQKFNHPSCDKCWFKDNTINKTIVFNENWFVGSLRLSYPDHESYVNYITGQRNIITIFTPSFNRAKVARLNWNHLMHDNGVKQPYLHFVFVRRKEFKQYARYWENFVAIVEVPDRMLDIEEDVCQGGIGYVRRFMQRFAYHQGVDFFYMCDDSIIYFKTGILDKDNHIRRNDRGLIEMEPVSFAQVAKEIDQIGSDCLQVPECSRHKEKHPKCPDDFVQSFSGPSEEYGVIGARKHRIKKAQRHMFRKSHCTSFMKINNKILVEKGILFKPWRALEDLHFCNDADQEGFNVVKLTNIEFVKAHSRGPLDLYIWALDEQVSQKEEGAQNRILAAMRQFIRSLKIATFNWFNCQLDLEIVKLINDEMKYHEDGLHLVFISDESMSSLRESMTFKKFMVEFETTWPQDTWHNETKEIVMIFPMKIVSSINFTTGPYDFIEATFDQLDIKVEDFVIASTHKPCVDNDFMIFQISLKKNYLDQQVDQINRKRSSIDSPESAPLKRLKVEEIESTHKSPNQGKKITDYFTLSSPSKRLKKEEHASASPTTNPSIPSSSGNQTAEENPQGDTNFFSNYYSFNSLQRCQDRQNDAWEPSVIVKVVSMPFDYPYSPKTMVRVEEVGDGVQPCIYQSCLMYWYAVSKPLEIGNLRPNQHYRIEKIRPKLDEEEVYNKFQLKLDKDSQIIWIPTRLQRCLFKKQSILHVTKGHNEFMDFSGKLIRYVDCKTKKRFIQLIFQCSVSHKEFILKSEPSSLTVSEIMKAYKGKTLKIRAARILAIKDARNEQTVIYKNFDAIRYLNDK